MRPFLEKLLILDLLFCELTMLIGLIQLRDLGQAWS